MDVVVYSDYISRNTIKTTFLIFFVVIALAGMSLRMLQSRWYANIGQLQLARAMVTTSDVQKQVAATNSEKWLRRAVSADGNNTAAQRGLGFALLTQGREDEAIVAWGDVVNLVTLEIMQRGIFMQQVGDLKKALKWYRLGQKLQPQIGDWLYYQGLVFIENNQWADAIKAFATGLPLTLNTVGQSDFYYQQGFVNIEKPSGSDVATALSLFDKALIENQFKSTGLLIETHFQRAEVLRKTEQTTEALVEYNEVLKLNPDDYRANLMAGILFWQIKHDGQTSIRLLKKAISLNPTLAPPRLILANIYYYIGEIDQAKKMYESVLAIEPSNTMALDQLLKLNDK